MAVAGGGGGRRARWQGVVGQEGDGREPDGTGTKEVQEGHMARDGGNGRVQEGQMAVTAGGGGRKSVAEG